LHLHVEHAFHIEPEVAWPVSMLYLPDELLFHVIYNLDGALADICHLALWHLASDTSYRRHLCNGIIPVPGIPGYLELLPKHLNGIPHVKRVNSCVPSKKKWLSLRLKKPRRRACDPLVPYYLRG
jgi:hypothetical protein